MSYEKQTWQTGDVVTSAKLNHMEDGIAAAGGGGVLVVNVTESEVEGSTVSTCDKTAGEMAAALEAGGLILRGDAGGGAYFYMGITQARVDPAGYTFIPIDEQFGVFTATSASEYPKSVEGPK